MGTKEIIEKIVDIREGKPPEPPGENTPPSPAPWLNQDTPPSTPE